MSHKIIMAVMTVTALALSGCASKKNNAESENKSEGKTFVVYYSQTGATKAVADEIISLLGCDSAEIEAVNPYDGDYNATIQRWIAERDSNLTVEIKPLGVDLDQYDTIFLGFPIWGGTFALPVKTFAEQNSLKGKKVITFATFGSGGIDNATADLKALQPDADIIRGYGVRNARVGQAAVEVKRFLIENGWLEGEAAPLPDYTEPAECTPEEVEIFNQACGDYQFPLGSPVKAGHRKGVGSTDYRFEVASGNDNSINSVIFVTVGDSVGAKPEFTEVVRL